MPCAGRAHGGWLCLFFHNLRCRWWKMRSQKNNCFFMAAVFCAKSWGARRRGVWPPLGSGELLKRVARKKAGSVAMAVGAANRVAMPAVVWPGVQTG